MRAGGRTRDLTSSASGGLVPAERFLKRGKGTALVDVVASDAKAVEVEARRNGPTVTLIVSDKGMGIPAEEIPRVTRKFSRGHGSEAGGSGLGLAIVDRIVRDHGGSLTIESQVGAGTSVAITLPVAN